MKAVLVLGLLCVLVLDAQAASLGWDRLLHTWGKFQGLPTTVAAANASGWAPLGGRTSCDKNLGIEYSHGGDSPSCTVPITLFFTQSGLLAGYSVFSGHTPSSQTQPYWNQYGDRWRITISTRNASETDLCDADSQNSEPIGDTIVINQAGAHGGYRIPVTDKDAATAGYLNGSCLPKMGRHWGWDVDGPPMSWEVDLFGPAIPMYWNGVLQTLFVNTPSVQLPFPVGSWEGPFPFNLMCLNFCTSKCDLCTTWSTMHFFFKDPDLVHCPSRC